MDTPTPFFRPRRLGALPCTLAVLLLGAASAQAAQPCRIDGRLVIRSGPCPVVTVAAPVAAPSSALVAAADDADAPKKRTIAEIMREREAANRSRPAAEPVQRDGASVLRDRMGAL
jgi:hypothetical protein